MRNLLKFKDVTHKYADLEVLSSLEVEFKPGQMNIILGQNGAGKSTLMRIAGGHENPTKGALLVGDQKINSPKVRNHINICLITEHTSFDLPWTLLEIKSYFSEIYPRWNEEYFQHLYKGGTYNIQNKYSDLSRGQKMQFCLCVHMATKPDILVLDEISSVLDLQTREFFMEEIFEFTLNGGTVLFSTNIIEEVDNYAHFVYMLKRGVVISSGEMDGFREEFCVLTLSKQDFHGLEDRDYCLIGTNDSGEKIFLAKKELVWRHTHLKEKIFDKKILVSHIYKFFNRDEGSHESAA